MKQILALVLATVLVSCASTPNQSPTERTPSATSDLTGTYLGEGIFSGRTTGLKRPAYRLYLEPVQGENDSYYGVLLEYDQLLNMGLPYLASQKAPVLNHVIGYLDKIAARISAYKFVPGSKNGTYLLYNLEVRDGQIVPAANYKMILTMGPRDGISNPLAGAVITGNSEGTIVFPDVLAPNDSGAITNITEAINITQYELARVVYKKGHLASTWRGNWKDLEGSYLSEYGRFKDGVLELYSQNSQQKMKFVKTNTTKAKYFTNPKSAAIEGDYNIAEPIPKMYVLVPTGNRAKTASDVEMTGRIGLFLDVFDGSAPAAGSHLVTELAFTNPQDPEDFMMYYEHPKHLRNVGVEPKK